VHETRFSEATVKAVIGKALSFEQQGGYSKSELRDAASELGISEAALEEAASAIRADRQKSAAVRAEEPIKERIRQQRRRRFVNHLIAYVGVNLIIVMPALMKNVGNGKTVVVFIPAIAWGIVLALHAIRAFSSTVEASEVRKAIEREDRAVARDAARRAALAGRLEKQARRDRLKRGAVEFGGAVEEGVASILSSAARKIREGAAPQGAPDPRVRVAATPGSTPRHDSSFLRAEAEAEAEAEATRARAARPARRS
jgi:hypothetical protein